MTIKTFGIWEINNEFGLIGNVEEGYQYTIPKYELWLTRHCGAWYEWEWAAHLQVVIWFTEQVVVDFSFALIFAQKYFIHLKPENLPIVKWVYSKYVQNMQLVFDEPPSKPYFYDGINI